MSDTAAKRAVLQGEFDELVRTYGENADDWPIGQAKFGERIMRGIEKLDAQDQLTASRTARADVIRTAMSDPANRENGFGGGVSVGSMGHHSDPWANLGDNVIRADSLTGLTTRAHTALERANEVISDTGREQLAQMLYRDNSSVTSAFVIAASDPAYERAFVKATGSEHGYRMWTADEQLAYQRMEAVRASMSDVNANGGYMLPIFVDPTIVITNTGIVNPVRALASIHTTVTAAWNGVASLGTTGTWTAENTALTDTSPAFSAIAATPNKLTAWITGSYEVFADTTASAQLPRLIADAFDVTEGTAFVVGSGTPPTPLGVVTGVAAVTASRVAPQTAGVFTTASVNDLYSVDNALPARARRGKPAWIAHRQTLNIIRAMNSSQQGSAFWANLGQETPTLLLDHPVYEASAMSNSYTTGQSVLMVGDFEQLYVIDRLGTTVEYVPNVFNASGIPLGQRGFIAHKRTTTVLANPDAFRVLRL